MGPQRCLPTVANWVPFLAHPPVVQLGSPCNLNSCVHYTLPVPAAQTSQQIVPHWSSRPHPATPLDPLPINHALPIWGLNVCYRWMVDTFQGFCISCLCHDFRVAREPCAHFTQHAKSLCLCDWSGCAPQVSGATDMCPAGVARKFSCIYGYKVLLRSAHHHTHEGFDIGISCSNIVIWKHVAFAVLLCNIWVCWTFEIVKAFHSPIPSNCVLDLAEYVCNLSKCYSLWLSLDKMCLVLVKSSL